MRSLPTCLRSLGLCLGLAVQTVAAEPFSGEWIEQADDPLKITLQRLTQHQFTATITLGNSSSAHRLQLYVEGERLLAADGTPVYALQNGKLRQLDSPLPVFFVRIRR